MKFRVSEELWSPVTHPQYKGEFHSESKGEGQELTLLQKWG